MAKLLALKDDINFALPQITLDKPRGGGLDDTANIMNAIASVPASDFRTVVARAGEYRVNKVPAVSGMWLKGQGWDTKFKRLDGNGDDGGVIDGHYQDPVVSNIRFSDFQIDGNKQNAPHGRGLNFENVGGRCIVENLWVHNCYQGGINTGGIGAELITRDCLAENSGANGNGWGQISFTRGGWCRAIHNRTAGSLNGESAFGINAETNPTGSIWLMSNVVLKDNYCIRGWLGVIGAGLGTVSHVKIKGNDVFSANSLGSSQTIKVTGQVGGRVQILDNNVTGDGPNACMVVNGRAGMRLDISDNHIYNMRHLGIQHYNEGVVRNNYVEAPNPTDPTTGAGIYANSAATAAASQYVGNTFSSQVTRTIGNP